MARPGGVGGGNLSVGILDACCCSVDRVWFDAMAEGAGSSRVAFSLTTGREPRVGSDDGPAYAGGGGGGGADRCCSFVLERRRPGDV